MYDEGSWTLRLKMDMESANPNMYDLVAYRIKYTPHPHAGSGWCIYPAYDFTHGICDSLEDIDYSICTLEFETRREPYYWILWALDMFRPAVYEMSRLNLQYTVLSKRRLLKLVEMGDTSTPPDATTGSPFRFPRGCGIFINLYKVKNSETVKK